MHVAHCDLALFTQIKLWTRLALPAVACHDVLVARVTSMPERRRRRVVRVVQNHGGAMLCSPQRVELVVVALQHQQTHGQRDGLGRQQGSAEIECNTQPTAASSKSAK